MTARRIVLSAAIVVALVVGALAGVFFFGKARFNPEPPEPDFAKPANALEAQRQDLEQFRRLVALDQSFEPAARVEANRQIDALHDSATALGWGRLRVALMHIAALADNGHTGIFSGEHRKPNAVPLRVSEFPDGLYVLRAKEADADLLGARVEKIDGQPIEQVLAKLDALHGGIPAWRRVYSQLWVQSPEMLNGIGVAPAPDMTVWALRRRDGSLVERRLKGEPLAKGETFEDATRWLSSEPTDKEPKTWRALQVALPLALADFNKTFRREWLGTSCVLFLQMKSIVDGPDQKIGDWLRETTDAMAERNPCAVILDLRFSTGGDYTNTWAFTHKLPDLMRPGARVFILTGPQTFSATITTTAFIKETLGDRAVIVGEPVGDRLKFLSEGNSGCLPNSGICFHYSTGMHDYSAPCTDWHACYWVNWLYPVRVKTLAPDRVVHLTFADYLSGRDPVFETALSLATANR